MLQEFSDDDLKGIYQKVSFLSYGMATLASQNSMPDDSTANIIEILRGAGGDIMFMTKARNMLRDPNVSDDEMNAMWGNMYE